MNNILVSIIVLSYNNLQYINRAIKSIEEQDYNNIELIISDDHSADYNEENINICKSRFTNVVVYSNQENLGTVRNYNGAIKKSSGDIIMPLACDDCFYDEHVVSDVVKFFSDTNCEICMSKRMGEISKCVIPSEKDFNLLVDYEQNKLLERVMFSNFVCGATLYFKRSLFLKEGPFDEKYRLIEDYPFIYKLIKKNIKIYPLDRITISYCESGVSNKKRRTLLSRSVFARDVASFYKDCIRQDIRKIKFKKTRRIIERYKKYESIIMFGTLGKLLSYALYVDVIMAKMKRRLNKDQENLYWTYFK